MAKNIFDKFFSTVGLVILAPIFLIISVWIKLDSKGEIFFRQKRIGLYGVPFFIHKFRTMYQDSEYAGRLTIGNDSRITASGKFLRKYKLDELPQLIDVFRGKMSLVGPRPEVPEFINAYPESIKNKILSVKPGITDLASIEMVDENDILSQYDDPKQAYIDIILPIKQKYYLEYVDNSNLLFDIAIILKTIKKIVTR